jgi:hypothetical protein
MDITRREALKGCAGTLLTLPLFGIGLSPAAEIATPVSRVDRLKNARRQVAQQRLARLMERCCTPGYNSAAHASYASAIRKPMLDIILYETELPFVIGDEYVQSMLRYNHTKFCTDYRVYIDWPLKAVRDKRWDILGHALQRMVRELRQELNEDKVKGSRIVSFEVYSDPCLHRHGRMGVYCIAKMESPWQELSSVSLVHVPRSQD